MDFHRIKNILQNDHTLLAHEWKGAVLFLCNDEYIFLIKRSADMPTHGGQIAFVGGHKNLLEVNPWDVARREYQEETSFNADTIEFLGYLPAVLTARLQPIIPVVCRVKTPTNQFINEAQSNGEWDDILAYPWINLASELNWEFAWRTGYAKSPVLFHTIKAGSFLSPNGNHHPHLLWGATASMIWDFMRLYFKK